MRVDSLDVQNGVLGITPMDSLIIYVSYFPIVGRSPLSSVGTTVSQAGQFYLLVEDFHKTIHIFIFRLPD